MDLLDVGLGEVWGVEWIALEFRLFDDCWVEGGSGRVVDRWDVAFQKNQAR